MHGLAKYVEKVEKEQLKSDLPELKIGMTLKVGVTVVESGKSRVQPYQGLLIAMHKNGINSTITVRKVFQGIGVERVFPIHSPLVTLEAVPTAGVPRVRPALKAPFWPTGEQSMRARVLVGASDRCLGCRRCWWPTTCLATSPLLLPPRAERAGGSQSGDTTDVFCERRRADWAISALPLPFLVSAFSRNNRFAARSSTTSGTGWARLLSSSRPSSPRRTSKRPAACRGRGDSTARGQGGGVRGVRLATETEGGSVRQLAALVRGAIWRLRGACEEDGVAASHSRRAAEALWRLLRRWWSVNTLELAFFYMWLLRPNCSAAGEDHRRTRLLRALSLLLQRTGDFASATGTPSA